MLWWQFALLGTIGGVIVEVLEVFRWVAVWQEARRDHRGILKRTPPKWRDYVDLPAHAFMLPTRGALGAGAAVLFGATGQVTGVYGAVAFGCAAPILLAQLGSIPQIARTISDVPAVQKSQASAAHDIVTAVPDENTVTAAPDGKMVAAAPSETIQASPVEDHLP